jgi:hypothetical protein
MGAREMLRQAGELSATSTALGRGERTRFVLPRHLSLTATATIGTRSFFLALAPSSGAWRPDHFIRDVARFAVPAAVVVDAGVVAAYLFALHDLDLATPSAPTVALTAFVLDGLYLVVALEAGGSWQRSTLVADMCAVMAGLYAVALTIPARRGFFELSAPDPEMVLAVLGASAITIVANAACGFSLRPNRPSRAADGADS